MSNGHFFTSIGRTLSLSIESVHVHVSNPCPAVQREQMSNYKKGWRNEQKSIEIFEAAGYRCLRSGGSFGDFDFIAVGPNDVVLVQVKSNRWTSAVEEE